jgi:hypothetical protein
VSNENYVAWMRFRHRADNQQPYLQICNSDDEGAFRVYRESELAAEQSRLDWLLARSHMSVHGSEKRGWVVCDQSNGLTIAGRGKTGREAIDNAMKEKS